MPDGPLPSFDVRADFWSLRFVDERCESYAVRKNVAMPYVASTDRGVMATVYVDGGYGYAATGDTSAAGLASALERAAHWARATARLALVDSRALPYAAPRGEFASPSFSDRFPSRREWYDLLHEESNGAGCDPRIIDWEAGVEVRVSVDVVAELWSKLMVNCAYNAISALAQASYGEMVELAPIRELQRTVVGEVVAVAAASGVELPLAAAVAAMERIAPAMPAQLSSTAQDVARRKPSEIDHLNGFVVRRGRELGIATPANQALHALVKLVESRHARA